MDKVDKERVNLHFMPALSTKLARAYGHDQRAEFAEPAAAEKKGN